jgi:ferredoxin
MKNNEMEEKLRKEALGLLSSGKVDWIIGFEKGASKFSATPLITREVKDISRLTISLFGKVNLAKYLIELKGKTGIISRGCGSRAVVTLIQDKKVRREDVVIIGVPCTGIIDLEKVEKLAGHDSEEFDEIAVNDDRVSVSVSISGRDSKLELALIDVLFDSCVDCEFATPADCDILVGEPTITKNRPDGKKIENLETLTPEERWRFWEKEFSRCIRCYACRNSCPACFCKQCFAQETEPQWIASLPRWQENLIFQAIRNIHVAGRCTDCGACERACPVHIPLRSLSKKMYDLVNEVYQFKAGTDKDSAPFMAHYDSSDRDGSIK